MLEKLFDWKKVKPQKGYETRYWSREAKRRGRLLRDIVNPKNLDLLVYYPGSGGETIFSRFIGAGTQVQVNLDYVHGAPFVTTLDRERDPDGKRREYKVQWLSVIDYWGDAYKIKPPEIQDGIDVLIDKCGIGFEDKPKFKAYIYNLIREGGYVIVGGPYGGAFCDAAQNFFIGFDPKLFEFNMVLDKEDRPSCKGEPFHLRVFRKNNGLYLPEELFEADLAIDHVKRDKKEAERYASRGWEYESTVDPIEVEKKIKMVLDKIDDAKLVSKLSEFSQAFLR